MTTRQALIRYLDEGGDEYGRREIAGPYPAFDEFVTAEGTYGELAFEPPLTFLESIALFPSSEDAEVGSARYTLMFDKFFTSVFRQNAFWIKLNATRETLAKCLEVNEVVHDQKDVTPTRSRAVIDCNLFMDPPFISIESIEPIGVFAEALCKKGLALESHIAAICELVIEAEVGVVSGKPRYYWPTQRPKVFVSHSSHDKDVARKVTAALRGSSIHPWLDEDEIQIGDDFIKQMEKGLAECDFVVVLLTPHFLSGPWAQEEYRTTLERQVRNQCVILLPALIETCDIPRMLASKRYADFRDDFGQGIEALSRTIKTRYEQEQRETREA
jgi:hypothetical protein